MRILLLAESVNVSSSGRYRIGRINEECSKRNVTTEVIFLSELLISGSGIFYNGKKISTSDFEAIYFLGNSSFGYYLVNLFYFYSKSDVVMWPDKGTVALRDKFIEGMFLESINVLIPKTILLSSLTKTKLMEAVDYVGDFPCVIKRVTGSCGRFVSMVKSFDEVINFINDKRSSKITGVKNLILQEFIKESPGVDYRIFCFKNEVLGGIKRTSQTDDFRANVSLGGKAEAFEVPKELEEICLKIMKEGKLFYAGLDFIWSEKRGWLAIEINTCAQFEGFEKATGINVAGKIVDKLLAKSCGK